MTRQEKRLATAPVGRLLLSLSLPATLGMASNALYNVVDGIFIGQGVGAAALGGVGVALPFQMIELGIGVMTGVGCASVVSRALGARDRNQAANAVGNTLLVIAFLSLAFPVAALLNLDRIIVLLGPPANMTQHVLDYLEVIIYGFPFLCAMVFSNNIMRAEGAARRAMRVLFIGTFFNVLLDPVFIFVLKAGVRGAGLATVISQALAALYALWFFVDKQSSVRLTKKSFTPRKKLGLEIFGIGFPAFIRQAGIAFSIALVVNVIVIYGKDQSELYITIFSITNRLILILFMPLFGLAQGFQPIAGYNYGARNFTRVRKVIFTASLWATLYGLVIFIVLRLAARDLFGLFTVQAEVIEAGAPLAQMIFLFFSFVGFQIIGATYFQSAGKQVHSLFLNLLRQIILLIPLVLILPNFFGLIGIFYAYPLTDIISVIVTAGVLAVEIRRLKKQSDQPPLIETV